MSLLPQIRVGKDEGAKLRLRDAYAWHQQLWSAFPGRDGQRRGFLFRVDDQREDFRVLLLSPEAPVQQAWGAWDVKQVADGFLGHDQYLFQVRANPTIKRVVWAADGELKKNGRRTPIYEASALLAWMERKGNQSGFALLQCTPSPGIQSYFEKDRRRGKHVAVDFRGTLRVTDRAAFQKTF